MDRVRVKVTIGFWVFLMVAVVLRQGYFAAMYSIAVVAHEAAHYVVASRLFYRCKEIRLGLFGAVLYGDFHDVTPTDRLKIALAGPLCNCALCLVCLALWWALPQAYFFTESFCLANATMAFVNLLPCYPLDGGRVLTALTERRLGGKRALALTKKITVGLSLALFGLFVVSLLTGDNLFAVGLFAVGLMSGIFHGGSELYVRTAFTVNRRRLLKTGMEKKTLVFGPDNTLADVVKRMQGNYLYCLEVVSGDMRVLRSFSVAELESLVLREQLSAPLGKFIRG